MNEEGQDFERLRQVLALKRHETPPPRYFKELPGRILSRLAKPESPERDSLWTRLGRLLGERPMFATAAGVAAGCALLAGLGFVILQDAAQMDSAGIPPLSSHGVALTGELNAANPVSLASSNANAGTELFNSFQPQAIPASATFPER